jgi:hypothetical protein
VEFSDRNGGTELLLKHEQLPNEESRDDHNKGWTACWIAWKNSYCKVFQ